MFGVNFNKSKEKLFNFAIRQEQTNCGFDCTISFTFTSVVLLRAEQTQG